jgi:formimidoylglutamate deiminase
MSDVTWVIPEFLYWERALQPGLALGIDAQGQVTGVKPAASAAGGTPLRGRALLPGLVNAHSHAFQRLIRGKTEYVAGGAASDDFWSWREQMYKAATTLDPDGVYVASRQAFLEMALAGVTAVGEFHYLHHAPDGAPYADRTTLSRQVIRAARDVGLRIALLRVAYARSGHQVAPNPRQRRFLDASPELVLSDLAALEAAYRGDAHVAFGLAPHSVRAVPKAWLETFAKLKRPIVHMHVSEQPAEISACLAEHGRRPVELVADAGLLGEGFTAVHAIHLQPHEISLFGEARATVCACPSTERNLGDGILPADQLLAAGASLCLGSDSQAHIDLLDEARQLEGHLRLARLKRSVLDPGGGEMSGLAARLLHLATASGAASLGLPGGALAQGQPADFFTVDLSHPSVVGASDASLLAGLVFGADKAAVRDVAVGGRFIVKDGHHPLTEESAQAFGALARALA